MFRRFMCMLPGLFEDYHRAQFGECLDLGSLYVSFEHPPTVKAVLFEDYAEVPEIARFDPDYYDPRW